MGDVPLPKYEYGICYIKKTVYYGNAENTYRGTEHIRAYKHNNIEKQRTKKKHMIKNPENIYYCIITSYIRHIFYMVNNIDSCRQKNSYIYEYEI